MRNIIFRIVTVTPLVVVISVIIIGNGITIDFPTIAFAIVTGAIYRKTLRRNGEYHQ